MMPGLEGLNATIGSSRPWVQVCCRDWDDSGLFVFEHRSCHSQGIKTVAYKCEEGGQRTNVKFGTLSDLQIQS